MNKAARKLFVFFIISIFIGTWKTFVDAENPETQTQLDAMDAILCESYQGTPEDYFAFAADQGKRIAAIADEILAQPNLTEEETGKALEMKFLAIEMASDEENSLANIKTFLDAHQELPEIKKYYQTWIINSYNHHLADFLDESISISERIAAFRETVFPLLPYVLRYSDAEKNDHSEWPNFLVSNHPLLPFPYALMLQAQILDPDGSSKLYIEMAEILKPIFENDIKEYEDFISRLVPGKSGLVFINPVTQEDVTDEHPRSTEIEANLPLSNYQEKNNSEYFADGHFKLTDVSEQEQNDEQNDERLYYKKQIQKDLKRARNVLGTAHRFQIAGQPMEYDWFDIKGNPVSIQDYREKIVLLAFLPFDGYRKYKDSRNLQLDLNYLKGLYHNLQSEGFEIITHDLNGEFNLELTQNSLEDLYGQDTVPWKTLYRLSPIPENHLEYGDHYGVWDGGVFLIDREGKVAGTYPEIRSPELLDQLKELIPAQTSFLSRYHLKERRKTFRSLSVSPDKSEKIDSLFIQLHQFKERVGLYPSTKKNLELTNILLSFPDALRQDPSLFIDKAQMLEFTAMDNKEKAGYTFLSAGEDLPNLPDISPETFYEEYDLYIDEILQNKEIDDIYKKFIIDHEYQLRHSRISDMLVYLRQMPEGHEEYAAKILAYYIRIYQHKKLYQTDSEKNLRIADYNEWLEGIDSLVQTFQEVDAKHGAHLAQQLSNALISPVLKNDSEEGKIENE